MLDGIWLWIVLALLIVSGVIAWVVTARAKKAHVKQRTPPAEQPPSAQTQAPPSPDTSEAAPRAPGGEGEGVTAQAEPKLEVPESAASRMVRLRARLARAGTLGGTLLNLLSRSDLGEEDWEEIEEALLMADVGAGPTDELLEKLRTRVKVLGTRNAEEVRTLLREELLALVDPNMDRRLAVSPVEGNDGEAHPATILMVGVNGTGKTTTVGKLARLLVAEDHTVLLGAADTFRAAAAEQLGTWGERVGVDVIRSEREGADPASVAFEAVKAGREQGVETVIIDTAGRLQNKAGLMDELGKIHRVVAKSGPISEVLLVLDATTGQNGMRQAEVFAEAVNVSGIVLTKLDGTAKGGIVISVQRELGVPVKFVGLGEGPDDLAPFDPEAFVDALLADSSPSGH